MLKEGHAVLRNSVEYGQLGVVLPEPLVYADFVKKADAEIRCHLIGEIGCRHCTDHKSWYGNLRYGKRNPVY